MTIVTFSGGYALTYFSLDIGLWACVITTGLCTGLGLSLCSSNIVTTVMKVLFTISSYKHFRLDVPFSGFPPDVVSWGA